jgi:hypothetical protein
VVLDQALYERIGGGRMPLQGTGVHQPAGGRPPMYQGHGNIAA